MSLLYVLSRYSHYIKASKFCLSLPKGAITNYVRSRITPLRETLGGHNISPSILSVMVTRRCNLNCSFCCKNWADNSDVRYADHEASVETFERLFSLPITEKSLLIMLTGGEPLLNPELENIIRYIRSQKKLVLLITNGTLLDSHRIERLLNAGLNDIQLSIYDETFDQLTKVLPDVAKKIPINASFVLLKRHLEQGAHFPLQVMEFCEKNNIHSFKINLCMSGVGEKSSNMVYEGDAAYSAFIKKCSKFKKLKCFLPSPPPQADRLSSVRLCRTPWSVLLCDAQGNFAPCCRLVPPPDGKYGNLFGSVVDNDAEILCPNSVNSPYARRLREALINSSLPLPKECIDCPTLYGETLVSKI